MNHIKVIPVEIGGAFGGKSVQVISPICVLLSRKAGRPVKIVITREETLKTNRPAPPSVITIKLGATKEGRLTAASATMTFDYGALYGVGGMDVIPFGSFTGLGPYRIPNFKIECFDVYTNKIPSGPYWGPTAVQAAFHIESQMDLLARALKIDPLEFRLTNAVEEGDIMILGMPFQKIGFKETIKKMQQYLAKRNMPERKNRGRGIACGFWAPGGGAAGANIYVNDDDTVQLLVGSLDISGSRTALAQMVAEELGIPYEKVSAVTGDTDTAPFSVMSLGSMITRSLANPVYRACQDVKEQLCQRAAPRMNTEISNLEFAKGRVQIKGNPDKFITLAELAHGAGGHNSPIEKPIVGHGVNGGFENSPVFVTATAEVEVDEKTGKVKVLSYGLVQDIGCAINPTVVEGQIQGAAAQGIGWALSENYIFNKGVMQNASLLDYRLPTALDIPFIDAMMVEVPFDVSPFGLRGAGEPPMVPTVAAIANAIHSAIGVRLTELPMNPEAVLRALKNTKKSA
jgi:xanthine dehydrogenase molybdenum-binding subunit